MSSPNLPSVPSIDDAISDIESKLSREDPSARALIVNKLRKMIDQDPGQFVKGLRSLLHDRKGDDE